VALLCDGAKLYALHVRRPVVNLMTPPETWRGSEEAAKIEGEQHKKELVDAITEFSRKP
jgi:hypothetical protein